MRRREFLEFAGAMAAAWPLAARAQPGDRMRRVAVLMNSHKGDPETQSRLDEFLKAMRQLGWSEGRTIQFDIKWAGPASDTESHRKSAAELVALAPDVLLTTTGPSTAAAQRVTQTVPIVFAMVIDPVGADIVESLARPGGNTTGFMQFEYSLSGKWLELLKQVAPGVTRTAVFRDPTNASGIGQFAVIQAMAPALAMEVTPINVRNTREIEQRISGLARLGSGGLIATGGQATLYRDRIAKLAVEHRLPAVYPYSYYADRGGLASYGPNLYALFREAAGYVDRILRGEKATDLAVQAPTKYELVINLKVAKLIGLDIPPAVLVRADRVIE